MSFAAPDSSCAVFLCKRFFPPPTHIYESVLPANAICRQNDCLFSPTGKNPAPPAPKQGSPAGHLFTTEASTSLSLTSGFFGIPIRTVQCSPPFPHDIYLPTTTRLLTQRFHHHSSHIVAHYSHVPFSCQLTAERFFMLLPR